MRHPLVKKLALFLLGPLAVVLCGGNAMCFFFRSAMLNELNHAHAPESAMRMTDSFLNAAFAGLFVLDGLAIAGGVGLLLFFYRRMAVPLLHLGSAMPDPSTRHLELARELPANGWEETNLIAHQFNHFQDRLRQTVTTIRKAGVRTAYLSAVALQHIRQTMQSSQRQAEIATMVFDSSQGIMQTIGETAQSAAQIAEATARELQTARQSYEQLAQAAGQVASAGERLQGFEKLVEELSSRSRCIDQILTLIQDIADQTSLLALNAGIEAARVGEAGRGFAIVAGEVRKVAQRTSDAAKEIGQNVRGIVEKVKETAIETTHISQANQQIQLAVEAAARDFHGMIGEFENSHVNLEQMSRALEQVSSANQQIHHGVSEIRDLSSEVAERMDGSMANSRELNLQTEEVLGLLSLFHTGSGGFEKVLDVATGYRDRLQQIMENIAARGVEVYDRKYQPVAGSNPPKFEVGYARHFDRELQSLLDDARREVGAIYFVLIDTNGYLPTHHSNCAHPVTGDPAVDNARSRQRRFYNTTEVERRRAANTEPYLLQTYTRDTGEVLDDVTMPVMVQGRRWGSLCVGVPPSLLLDGETVTIASAAAHAKEAPLASPMLQ